jgi:hypothetical protein
MAGVTHVRAQVEPTGRQVHAGCFDYLVGRKVLFSNIGDAAILKKYVFGFKMKGRLFIDNHSAFDEYLH